MAEQKYKPATLDEQAEAGRSTLTVLRAAVAAYLGGAPYDWIAERHGYTSAQSARTAIERFLGETHNASDLTAARNKARARYERLLQGTWYDATHPFMVDAKGQQLDERNEAYLGALDRARGLVGDLARLDGLNAPSQLQLYVPGAEELMQVVNELRETKMAAIAKEGDIWGEVVEDGDDDLPAE